MRDLVRLIVVAAMSFAVVGVAMVYSRGGSLEHTFQAVAGGVSGVVDDVGAMVAGSDEDAAPALHTLSLARPHAAHWVGLAGFPDQAEISFPVPAGGQFVAGALALGFDTQLTDEGDGLLTLSVNGTPRGQVVLNRGRASHQVRIDLTAADLAGDRVVLHMAGRGTTNSGQICPTDAANSGSAVTLTATSRLELTSETPFADAVARLAIAPQPFVIGAPLDAANAPMALWAAQQFERNGLSVRFGQAGTDETALAVSDHVVTTAGTSADNVLVGPGAVHEIVSAAGAARQRPLSWPVSVGDLGAETIVKTFRGSRRWVVPFNASDLPGGALPEQFRLRLKTTPLAGSHDWVVRITLNGNLIETQRLPGNNDSITMDVALSAERMLPRNALTVELVDTTPNEGICTRAPDAQAQMLPESALIDLALGQEGWPRLIEALAQLPNVSLSSGDLTAPQATQASAMLGAMLPNDAEMEFASADARIQVATRNTLAQHIGTLDGRSGRVQVVLPHMTASGAGLTVLTVPSASFGAALEMLGPDDVLLLVRGL